MSLLQSEFSICSFDHCFVYLFIVFGVNIMLNFPEQLLKPGKEGQQLSGQMIR